jgi:hypothetical protein
MAKRDMEFLTAQTRKLEAAGIVEAVRVPEHIQSTHMREVPISTQPLHPYPRRRRKRVHASGYARLKAHRRKKSGIRLNATDDNEIGL